ncbi:hypothetical protein [Herbiconiux daphne]|uniref:TPM domain-containing protein n=1 Tax=Herbiconiux daphne TaxID=2970914 RepID=A0ABT2H5Y6_9MICO|nr:hypothetical protein [Herbiconiux daphne]MCS5735344.1 hypothetical protein [Herbiconiux daphne]
MGDFSLIPSFIVFGVVIVALIVGLAALRRRARRRIAPEIGRAPARVPVDDLVRSANIQLVQMDDAIRSAEEEHDFALAEFGEESTRAFADAIVTARSRASEAFALKQRLDDEHPDSDQQRRDWSKRILALSDSALALVTTQSRSFEQQRRLETAAPAAVKRVHQDVAAARHRIEAASAQLDDLRGAYAPSALSAADNDTAAASEAFERAEQAATEAERALQADPLAPVSKLVQQAESDVRRGTALLDAVERTPAALATARAETDAAIQAARGQLAEAARLRDTVEDAAATALIVEASSRLESLVAKVTARAARDPFADAEALSEASARLDDTLAVARSAQQRLDAARAALVGAIAIASSHIETASAYISGRRGRVGPDARTRLAAAERELQLARLEADPVAALDGARRAATLATDADALARYDAGAGAS